MNEAFRKFAQKTAELVGSVGVFIVALMVVVVWAMTGPLFRFSDTWQLVINTGTTIVTFLMVFMIQNTQNRDNKAIQAKLDELIVHNVGADDRLLIAEDLTDEQLKHLKEHFERLANGEKKSRRAPALPRRRRAGGSGAGGPGASGSGR